MGEGWTCRKLGDPRILLPSIATAIVDAVEVMSKPVSSLDFPRTCAIVTRDDNPLRAVCGHGGYMLQFSILRCIRAPELTSVSVQWPEIIVWTSDRDVRVRSRLGLHGLQATCGQVSTQH
jgi:hypothetical protein